MNYWLMKSEPDVYGIDDLKKEPGKRDHWDGVRNYEARNSMQAMKKGDQVFFYHSNCAEPGIVGTIEVAREAYPDHTAFDPDEKYFDPKSDPEKPRWFMVDVRYKRKFKRTISLKEMKEDPDLQDFRLVQKGSRLSILPVTDDQWQHIMSKL